MPSKSPTIPPKQSEGRRLLARFCEHVALGDVAHAVGVTRQGLHQIILGRTGPGLELAFAIEKATYGSVPADSWLKPAKKKDEAA